MQYNAERPSPVPITQERETAEAEPELRPAPRYVGAGAYYRGVGNSGNKNEQRAGSEHLPTWLRQHQNQSPDEQENALRQEPGFNRLSPQQQQERINTLRRLNAMPQNQRELTLMRMENIERLSPQRKEALKNAASQLSDMPQDRQRMVRKAIRDLRDMPPEQRGAVMNTGQFAGQFSAQERSIMSNLLAVEPYQHPGPPQTQPQYGK